MYFCIHFPLCLSGYVSITRNCPYLSFVLCTKYYCCGIRSYVYSKPVFTTSKCVSGYAFVGTTHNSFSETLNMSKLTVGMAAEICQRSKRKHNFGLRFFHTYFIGWYSDVQQIKYTHTTYRYREWKSTNDILFGWLACRIASDVICMCFTRIKD